MPHARLDGFEMYYERHGTQGEPLVLVHGYTGDVSDWQHQIEGFAASHRVLVMDHRGHGRSGAPRDRESYTVERMSDDVEALVAHVGMGRYHLVGHSMGGMVAQEIALRSEGRPAGEKAVSPDVIGPREDRLSDLPAVVREADRGAAARVLYIRRTHASLEDVALGH